jgi:hypothetical protein
VKPRRFVIEGAWSGYVSSQERVVHRKVYPGAFKRLRAWAEKTHAIIFTDGTALMLSVRECRPRERVAGVDGYTRLIEDCAHYDVSSVSGLYAAKEAVVKGEVKP